MSTPARLAEPGERFILIGHPAKSGEQGMALYLLDEIEHASVNELPRGEAGQLMALEMDSSEYAPDGTIWCLPRRWCWAIDGGEHLDVDEREDLEVPA